MGNTFFFFFFIFTLWIFLSCTPQEKKEELYDYEHYVCGLSTHAWGGVFFFFFFKFRWIKKIGELNICGVVWMGVAFL